MINPHSVVQIIITSVVALKDTHKPSCFAHVYRFIGTTRLISRYYISPGTKCVQRMRSMNHFHENLEFKKENRSRLVHGLQDAW